MLVMRVIGTKILRRPNTSATMPRTRGWLVSVRSATTRSRTLATWSPWGSKIGSPTSRATKTRVGVVLTPATLACGALAEPRPHPEPDVTLGPQESLLSHDRAGRCVLDALQVARSGHLDDATSPTSVRPCMIRTSFLPRPTRSARRLGAVALTLATGLALAPVTTAPASAVRLTDEAIQTTPATSFRVGTFNVLGADHTAPGGNRRGWDSGIVRMDRVVGLLGEQQLDVVGFQELQPSQAQRFQELVGTSWQTYPGLDATIGPS